MHFKPPLGVMPWWLWSEANPSPTVADLLSRYVAVSEAVARYRRAGLKHDPLWFAEVLGHCPPDPVGVKKR